jgi:hypothetical protein
MQGTENRPEEALFAYKDFFPVFRCLVFFCAENGKK